MFVVQYCLRVNIDRDMWIDEHKTESADLASALLTSSENQDCLYKYRVVRRAEGLEEILSDDELRRFIDEERNEDNE